MSATKQIKSIHLTTDCFGFVQDETGFKQSIKRFTWKNHNKIEVQLITYGATITSMKIPDRNNKINDIVLGFDDIGGYVENSEHHFGAIIGRFAKKIPNATFHINQKQHFLSKNLMDMHHADGGFRGFDKQIWEPYVIANKVILSHVSRCNAEGYPGDLLVQIQFELTQKNEFQVDVTATTTAPTIVNITNNVFFNLAGHDKGEEEMHKHTVILNANCYTPVDDGGFPTGKVVNVTNTKFDFQTPKILKHVMKGVEGGEYDQNFCVNRGVEQGDCFVGRVTHMPSGRVLEVYSNQSGVHLYTANRFSAGIVDIPTDSDVKTEPSMKSIRSVLDEDLILIERLHEETCRTLKEDSPRYEELRDLIKKIRKLEFDYEDNLGNPPPNSPTSDFDEEVQLIRSVSNIELTPRQMEYLTNMKMAAMKFRHSGVDFPELFKLIQEIINCSVKKNVSARSLNTQLSNIPQELVKYFVVKNQHHEANASKIFPASRKEGGIIRGKRNVIYRKHGAFCIQTQNYPNAIYHANFPSCVLNPGEKYCHRIVYKFWLMDGYPNNWIKRDFFCPPYKYN